MSRADSGGRVESVCRRVCQTRVRSLLLLLLLLCWDETKTAGPSGRNGGLGGAVIMVERAFDSRGCLLCLFFAFPLVLSA